MILRYGYTFLNTTRHIYESYSKNSFSDFGEKSNRENLLFFHAGWKFSNFYMLCYDLPKYDMRDTSTITVYENVHEIKMENIKKLGLNYFF